MNPSTLSVVLCTYNGAAHLREQLDSILWQTRKPDEVVVGDDGSTDATWSLLEEFEGRARASGIEVRLQRNERNLGFVGNFSRTLMRASGSLVFLCDQDDVWHPDKMAVMAGRFDESAGLLLLFSEARLVDAGGSALPHSLFEALELKADERRSLRAGHAFDVLLRRSVVTGATAGFRRELIDVGLPVGHGWIHDEWLAAVAAALGRVGMVEQALIDYRQHAGNQIGMRKRTLSDKWADLVRPRQEQFIGEVGRLDALRGHLASLQCDLAKPLDCVAQKREHFERRVVLGSLPRLARLRGVLKEAACGGYRRYGTGGRSMLRDLLRRG